MHPNLFVELTSGWRSPIPQLVASAIDARGGAGSRPRRKNPKRPPRPPATTSPPRPESHRRKPRGSAVSEQSPSASGRVCRCLRLRLRLHVPLHPRSPPPPSSSIKTKLAEPQVANGQHPVPDDHRSPERSPFPARPPPQPAGPQRPATFPSLPAPNTTTTRPKARDVAQEAAAGGRRAGAGAGGGKVPEEAAAADGARHDVAGEAEEGESRHARADGSPGAAGYGETVFPPDDGCRAAQLSGEAARRSPRPTPGIVGGAAWCSSPQHAPGTVGGAACYFSEEVRCRFSGQRPRNHKQLCFLMVFMTRQVEHGTCICVVPLGNTLYKFSGSCYDTKAYQNKQITEGLPDTGGISGVFNLRFVDAQRPNDPLYTCCPVKWQDGENAKVAIFRNEKQIMDGDLSKLQIEILPVHADFFTEQGQADFTKEEFNKQIYLYKGEESILTTIRLKNGESNLGSFCFKESSYGKKLRLAARAKRQDPGVRVQEAFTDLFVVKDRRSEFNEKCYLPKKEDAVHRLKKISPKGKRCIALEGKKITKVKHLMRQYHKDKSGLQELTGMKRENWYTMINHASMCDPGDEIYSYTVAEENCELLFNDFFNLVGMMIKGVYVPVSDLDQFQQLNNWKMSAYKGLEERENSGDLIPDYLMRNGFPTRAVPLNNEAGPSVQASTAWQYANDMAAQQEFGEQHPFRQQNVFSPVEVLSNNDAGPSKQEAPLFSQHTAHQDLGQHCPSMTQNGTPYNLSKGNISNDQGSFSANQTLPSQNICPVPQDDLNTCTSLTGQQSGYLSSWTTDAPGASYPVTDGVSQGTSSLNYVEADIFSGLIDELLAVDEAHGADQDFIPANDAQLPNFDNQFHSYEHDDGNW